MKQKINFSTFKSKIFYFYLPIFIINIIGCILSALSFHPIILTLTIILGLTPLFIDIVKSISKKEIPLELPALVTIIILIFLQKYFVVSTFILIILSTQIFKEFILYKVEKAIKLIQKILPKTAFVYVNNKLKEIAISSIRINDIIAIKPGDRTPVDGILFSKNGFLDYSVITGE